MLTATGTPTSAAASPYTYALNTTPGCSFSRTTNDGSANGSASVSAFSCATASAGTMTAGTAVSGVTQTITATVTTVGTYSISTTANGVTFAGSGTFAATGAQNVVLTATGTPSAAGSNSFTLNTTPNCSFTRTTNPAALPANITLGTVNDNYIASVRDADYSPYVAPTTAATFAQGVAADGSNESTLIDVQGTLTTTGVTISIPYTVTGAPVTLPAFTQTINVPASSTQDGIARDITFSYAGGTFAVGSNTIAATVKSVGGTLNVKKLDLQTGIGNDNLGVLLAQFTYATNSAGGTAPFALRAIAGIPDRNIATADHVMLYVPVTSTTGKTWLNNNLGANYANATKTAFNPTQQATSSTDFNAYGSLFQWSRKADSHELINWTSGTAGTQVNGTTTTLADNPANALFIRNSTSPYDWRTTQDGALWATVASANNPCPIGFRVPTSSELNAERIAFSSNNTAGALASVLKLPVAGFRYNSDGSLYNTASYGHYWSSTVNGTSAINLDFHSSNASTYTNNRANGMSVRCLKDY